MTDAPPVTRSGELRCERLTVCRGARPVLHDVELTIRKTECVTLIGPNGSGKTTLMLALLGLLPPSAGGVRLDGKLMHKLSGTIRGRFASYVPQVVERLPGFRVRDVVASGRYPHVPALQPLSREDLDIVDDALTQCGLVELAERPVNAISGGERQKTLIAAAVAQDARVMFLDEPSTALDPAYQVELVRLLRRWHGGKANNEQQNPQISQITQIQTGVRGLVLISHDLHLPSVLGGRVVALRDGRVVADGAAAEVLTPERLSEIYGAVFDVATHQRWAADRGAAVGLRWGNRWPHEADCIGECASALPCAYICGAACPVAYCWVAAS